MSSQQLQLPVASSSSSCRPSILFNKFHLHWSSNKLPLNCNVNSSNAIPYFSLDCHRPHHHHHHHHHHYRRPIGLVRVDDGEGGNALTATAVEDEEPTPEDLEYISQIKTVLELLKKNRDMLFGEVKLTIMIEDPREVERRRLLGIDDSDAPTRDDLAAALEEVVLGV